MDENRLNVDDDDEARMQRSETNNPQTIRGEETVGDDEGSAETNLDDTTSTRTRSGVIPSSYGSGGGMTTPERDRND